ncbi:MAG: hypothetical protein QXY42_04275, partial [Candidatus Bathyarchaeia archaeon]
MKFVWISSTSLLLMCILGTALFVVPFVGATSNEVTLKVAKDYRDYGKEYELKITIPSSLYNHYRQLSHKVDCRSDYLRFVTPDA